MPEFFPEGKRRFARFLRNFCAVRLNGQPDGEGSGGMSQWSCRLRRGISTRKLTTYRHSSEKPNGAFRRYCQNRRRGADREATPGLCGRAISQASLQSRTTTQSAEPASRFPPLVLNISARVSGHLPEPLRPAPIAFMSGLKNPTTYPPQAALQFSIPPENQTKYIFSRCADYPARSGHVPGTVALVATRSMSESGENSPASTRKDP